MTAKRIYLDFKASTPLAPEVVDEMRPLAREAIALWLDADEGLRKAKPARTARNLDAAGRLDVPCARLS